MRGKIAVAVVISVSGCGGAAAFHAWVGTDMTVRIYLEWKVFPPAGYAARAKAAASQLFSDAGIALKWYDGAPRAGAGPEVIGITVEPEAPREFDTRDKNNALAAALPYGTGPVRIQVFYDRLTAYAGTCGASASIVAGHVLAHEIGHVLEGVARHSESGLMRARWSTDDLWRMTHFELRFATEDRILIRSGLRGASSTDFGGAQEPMPEARTSYARSPR